MEKVLALPAVTESCACAVVVTVQHLNLLSDDFILIKERKKGVCKEWLSWA